MRGYAGQDMTGIYFSSRHKVTRFNRVTHEHACPCQNVLVFVSVTGMRYNTDKTKIIQ